MSFPSRGANSWDSANSAVTSDTDAAYSFNVSVVLTVSSAINSQLFLFIDYSFVYVTQWTISLVRHRALARLLSHEGHLVSPVVVNAP